MAQSFPGGRGAWQGQAAGPSGLGPEPPVVHEPGGMLVKSLQTTTFDTFEYGFSRSPGESIYQPSVSLNQPVVFDMGQYKVPKGRMLLLTNYRFGIVGLSGLEAGGGGELPAEQFQNSIGFDLTVNRIRPSTLQYQLIPTTGPVRVTGSDGNVRVTQAPASQPVSPAGLSLLPPRSTRQGDPELPFTIYGKEGQGVNVSAVVYRRISMPIVALTASVQGYLISQQVGESLLQRLRFR